MLLSRLWLIWSTYWRALLTVALPLAYLPLPLVVRTPAAECAYVLLVMASFWMLELLPLAVTSLIPVALFPMLGIMSTGDTCMLYMKSTCMLFLGGENTDFRQRIAFEGTILFFQA